MSEEGAIEFACPSCDHVTRVPASFAGKQGRCPSCNALLEVPVPEGFEAPAAPSAPATSWKVDEPEPAPIDDPGPAEDELRPCPMCGEHIKRAAKKCRFCGDFLKGGKRPRQDAAVDRSTEMPGAADYILCVFCGCVGLIVGVVAILQGYHRRGLIMIGLSLLVSFLAALANAR